MDFYAGVPDSLLKNICAYITDNLPAEQNIIAANERWCYGHRSRLSLGNR